MNNDNINLFKFIHLNVSEIDLDKTIVIPAKSVEENTIIHLYIKEKDTDRFCDFCGSNSCIIHDRIKKEINHCILLERKIKLIFYQIKFKCKFCKTTHLQTPSFIGSTKSISKAGEIEALHQLRKPNNTFEYVSSSLSIPETTLVRLFDNHVDIKRHTLGKRLCFDEFYSKKLGRTKYCFTIYDLDKNEIIDILDSRYKEVLLNYFSKIPLNERLNVEFVNIDMWSKYYEVAIKVFPNATVCVDSFHVIEHLISALDGIRKRIQNTFLNNKDTDRNGYYWILKSFHYYLTTNMDNIKYNRKPRSHYSYLYTKYDVLEKVLSTSSDLRIAYALKESYREFNITANYDEAKEKIPEYIEVFKASKFAEFREFGRMIERWQNQIINSFIVVNGKRNSNGPIESLNSRIKKLISRGNGFKSFERFRNKVMFSLNKNEPIK